MRLEVWVGTMLAFEVVGFEWVMMVSGVGYYIPTCMRSSRRAVTRAARRLTMFGRARLMVLDLLGMFSPVMTKQCQVRWCRHIRTEVSMLASQQARSSTSSTRYAVQTHLELFWKGVVAGSMTCAGIFSQLPRKTRYL